MIANDHELQVTLERIARFQAQVAHLRQVEAHPANYHAAASGFLAEIDRMQLVFCQDEIIGYSLLNFTRASSVVNCQCALALLA